MRKISAKTMIEKLSASLEKISVKHIEWAREKHKAEIKRNKETTIKEAMKDSTGTEKVQAEKKDVQKAVQWWWLLVIAAAIVFIVRHIDR